MDPVFHINHIPKNEDERNLLNEALVSQNPPLVERAQLAIEAIQQNRLQGLDGSDRLNASTFFELLSGLPPLEGQRSYHFLCHLHGFDFKLQNFLNELDAMIAQTEESGVHEEADDGLDEFGYAHGEGFIIRTQSSAKPEETVEADIPLTLDVLASTRESQKILMELVLLLIEIDSHELRSDLIADCGKIVQWRNCLDITSRQEPD